MRTTVFQQVRRFIDLHRRGLAAIAMAICIMAMLKVLAPPAPPSRDVVVAAHDIPAGTTITAGDVAIAAADDDQIPHNTFTDRSAVIGRVNIVAIASKTILGTDMFLGGTPPPAGMRQIPVRISEPEMAQLIVVGSRVSAFGTSPDGTPTELAASVRVAAIPRTEQKGELRTTETPGAVVVLEVQAEKAAALANASLQRSLSLILG